MEEEVANREASVAEDVDRDRELLQSCDCILYKQLAHPHILEDQAGPKLFGLLDSHHCIKAN